MIDCTTVFTIPVSEAQFRSAEHIELLIGQRRWPGEHVFLQYPRLKADDLGQPARLQKNPKSTRTVKFKAMRGTVQTARRSESKLQLDRLIPGGEFSIADQIDKKGRVKIVTLGLPLSDRAWEMSWVFLNRTAIEMSRLRHGNDEAVPSSNQSASLQRPVSSVNGSKPAPAVALTAPSTRRDRLRFGYQRIDLEAEYTRTNLG